MLSRVNESLAYQNKQNYFLSWFQKALHRGHPSVIGLCQVMVPINKYNHCSEIIWMFALNVERVPSAGSLYALSGQIILLHRINIREG